MNASQRPQLSFACSTFSSKGFQNLIIGFVTDITEKFSTSESTTQLQTTCDEKSEAEPRENKGLK